MIVNLVNSFSEFESFVHQHPLILVDFWAEWCHPCVQFGKIYEKTAETYPEIVFAKINVDESRELAEGLEIRSIPHLMVFKNGIAIYSAAGNLPESALKELVQQAIDVDMSKLESN